MNEIFIVRNASTEEIELKDFGLIISPGIDTELGEFDKASLSDELDSYLQSGNILRIIDGSTASYSEAYSFSAPIYNLDVSSLNNTIGELETSVGWISNNMISMTNVKAYVDPSLGFRDASISWLNTNKTSFIYVDGSLNAKVNRTLFDASILSLTNKDLSLDASILLRPLTTYVDGSLNLKVNRTLFDSSILSLTNKDLAQDASILLRPLTTYVDGSLNLKVNRTLFDSSILSLTNKDLAQDASILLRPLTTYVDGSLNLKVNRTLFDTSIGELTIKNTNQDSSIIGIWNKLGNVDSSLNNLGIKNAAQDVSINQISLITSQFDVSNGILYVYDSVRGKWLSDKIGLSCGRATASATGTVFMKNGDAVQSSTTGFRMNRKGVITGLSVQNNNSVTVARNVEVRVNNSTTYKLNGTVAIGTRGFEISNGNIDVSVGDILQVVATAASAGAALSEAIVVVEVTGRR